MKRGIITLFLSSVVMCTSYAFSQDSKRIKIVKTNNRPDFLKKDLVSTYSKKLSELKRLRSYVEKKGFPRRKESQSDLDFIIQSMSWVTSQWKHNGWNKAPSKYGALKILKKVHSEGEQYRCVEYGLVLTEILQAYGFLSRSVGLNSLDVDYGGFGRGHVASEIWSNELEKWIFFDPQFGVYIEKNNKEPLNFYEIYREHEKNKWKNLTVISLWGVETGSSPKDYKKFISQYFGYLNVRLGRDKYALGLSAARPVLTFQGMQGTYRIFTKNHELIYPQPNRVTIFLDYNYDEPSFESLFKGLDRLSPKELQNEFNKMLPSFAAKPKFKVTMRNNMPNFSYYEYKTSDASNWVKLKNKYIQWEAVKEHNLLYVRAINKLQQPGPPTFIEIEYK